MPRSDAPAAASARPGTAAGSRRGRGGVAAVSRRRADFACGLLANVRGTRRTDANNPHAITPVSTAGSLMFGTPSMIGCSNGGGDQYSDPSDGGQGDEQPGHGTAPLGAVADRRGKSPVRE